MEKYGKRRVIRAVRKKIEFRTDGNSPAAYGKPPGN
jgi:hypothetical protein